MTPYIDADAKIRANTALSSLNSTPCSTPVMCRRIADSKIRANSALSLTKSAMCSTPDINSGMPLKPINTPSHVIDNIETNQV